MRADPSRAWVFAVAVALTRAPGSASLFGITVIPDNGATGYTENGSGWTTGTDGDVDLSEFGAFQMRFGGPNQSAAANCPPR